MNTGHWNIGRSVEKAPAVGLFLIFAPASCMVSLLGLPALENAVKLPQLREQMDYINRVASHQNMSRL